LFSPNSSHYRIEDAARLPIILQTRVAGPRDASGFRFVCFSRFVARLVENPSGGGAASVGWGAACCGRGRGSPDGRKKHRVFFGLVPDEPLFSTLRVENRASMPAARRVTPALPRPLPSTIVAFSRVRSLSGLRRPVGPTSQFLRAFRLEPWGTSSTRASSLLVPRMFHYLGRKKRPFLSLEQLKPTANKPASMPVAVRLAWLFSTQKPSYRGVLRSTANALSDFHIARLFGLDCKAWPSFFCGLPHRSSPGRSPEKRRLNAATGDCVTPLFLPA